jgi:hypothetical protein
MVCVNGVRGPTVRVVAAAKEPLISHATTERKGLKFPLRFSRRPVLVSCDGDDEVGILRCMRFLSSQLHIQWIPFLCPPCE